MSTNKHHHLLAPQKEPEVFSQKIKGKQKVAAKKRMMKRERKRKIKIYKKRRRSKLNKYYNINVLIKIYFY